MVVSDRLTKDALLVVSDYFACNEKKMRIAGLLFKSGGMRVGMSGQAAGSSVTHPLLIPTKTAG